MTKSPAYLNVSGECEVVARLAFLWPVLYILFIKQTTYTDVYLSTYQGMLINTLKANKTPTT